MMNLLKNLSLKNFDLCRAEKTLHTALLYLIFFILAIGFLKNNKKKQVFFLYASISMKYVALKITF